MAIYYVSVAAANGIGAGSADGDGSAAQPFLTLDQALAIAKDGDEILLNDGTYAAAGSFDLTHAVTIDSVVPGGATIEGGAGQAPITIDVTNGGTVTLGAVTIDAQNGADAISLASAATAYTLDLTGTQILDATGYAVTGQTDTRVNITATDVTYAAGVSRGLLGLPSLSAGQITIEGGSVTIADQMNGRAVDGTGQTGSASLALIDANAQGVSVHVTGVTVNATMDAADEATAGLMVMNVADALIENNAITLNGAAQSALAVEVSYDRLVPLDSSGAIIRDNTIDNFNSGGGAIIFVGQDGYPGASLVGYADDAQIYGNVGLGDAAAQAADLHGILVGWQSGASVYDNEMDDTALAYVMKGDFGVTVVFDNLDTDTSDKAWYQKAGTGVQFLDNASYDDAGFTPVGLYIGPDPEPGQTFNASGGVAEGNTVWYAGPSGHFVYVAAGSSIAALDDNHYHADGKLNSAAWYWQGTGYATLAQWQAAHEADATGTQPGLTFAQFRALLAADGYHPVLSLDAAAIAALTPGDIATLAASGLTTLIATDAKPVIGNADAIAFGQDGVTADFPAGDATFSAPAGKIYTAVESDYNATHALTDQIYSGVSGEPYTSYQYDYDTAGGIVARLHSGVTGEPYTSYEKDYTASGLLFDVVFRGVTGEPYTSYRSDYDSGGHLADKVFSGVTGEDYTSYQYDYDTAGNLVAKIYSGVGGEPYTSYRDDYDAAGHLIDKSYSGVTGAIYTSYQYDYDTAGDLVTKIYSGISDESYTSYRDDYGSAGQLLDKSYFGVTGEPYLSDTNYYDAKGAEAYTLYDNQDGTFTIKGREAGLTLTGTSGNDSFTGGFGSDIFDFAAPLGHDTVTDFAANLTGANHDTLMLSAPGIGNFAALLAATTFDKTGATITVDAADTIRLSGLTQSLMTANQGDFAFAAHS